MGKRWWWAVVLAMCAGMAVAGGPGAVRKQVELSMLVKGTIDVKADGSVAGYTLDNAKNLPEGIVKMIAGFAPKWRFEPVNLSPNAISARAQMSVRLVAKKLDDGNFAVAIRGTQFHQDRPGEDVTSIKLDPPRYPVPAARSGVGGSVYLVVKVGRDGRVTEAIAEQVNLRVITSERDMALWREMLMKAALKAAQGWTFKPPTRGDGVDEPYWSARIPVDFISPDQSEPKEGHWQAYVPGPRQKIPWKADGDVGQDDDADAFAAGGVYPVGAGPRLLSVIDPS